MRILALCLLILVHLAATPLFAADILIIQSMRDQSFTDVLKGFGSSCNASSKTMVLSDYVDVDISRVVREEQPALIVTLGESALSSVRRIRRTPVLSLMSLGLSMGRQPASNVTGVGMVAAPERYLNLFNVMRVKRIGVIYNALRSSGYLHRARKVLERGGMELVALETKDPREIPRLLASLKGRVDALWLLPDTTALSPATADSYFYFSMDQWKPVVAFSGVYLSKGAAAVLDIDRYELGRQSGLMARRLLDGVSPGDIPFQDPAAVVVRKNQRINEKLGLRLSDPD